MNTQFNGMEAKIVPYSPSLLKSALQKSVRRGEVDKALSVAKSLLEKDARGCLRRLMVIVLEDGLLLPDYDKLAILTDRIRLKGSNLTEEDKSLVLSMVADLTALQWRDFDIGNPDFAADYKLAKLADKELDLINAINLRVRLGGWQDDMRMLRGYAKIWNKRFAEKTWDIDKLRSYFSGEKIEWADVACAKDEDILLEAIDFHCSPVGKILLKKPTVSKLIQEAMSPESRGWAGQWQSDEDILNKIVWCLRSGVSRKLVLWTGKPIDWLLADKIPEKYWDDFKRIYEKIEPELNNICQWYLDKAGA
ncbi:MAG TPA: hypothetical protein VGF75_05775 [Candidatus Saccharimonadales bacterium]|jgi:hypothetical protein